MDQNPQAQNQTPTSPQTAQTQSPQIPPPANPVKPASKFSLKAIIGIIIFLLLAGGAAASFTVFKPQIMKLISKPSPSPSPTEAPAKAGNPTADWKTYQSVTGAFSFKYPSDYKLFENAVLGPDGVSTSAKQTITLQSTNIESSNSNFVLSIYYDQRKNLDTLQQVATSLSISKQGVESSLGGTKAYFFEDTPLGPYGSSILYTENGNKSYTISIESHEPYSRIKNNVDQILSTFKFTNQETVDTSNWKSYEGNGYSFKYPSNWFLSSCANPDVILLNPTEQPCETEGNAFAINIVPVKTNDYTFSEFKKGGNLKSETTINVDGYNAPQALLVSSPFEYTETKIKVLNEALEFDLYNENEKEIYDQILSTFKFTDSQTLSTPTPTCIPRPACLDSNPRCMIAEPASGWCP